MWKKYREDLNIASIQLSKVNTEHVLEYHAAIAIKSDYAANRMVFFIRKLFNYTKVKGYCSGENPAAKLKKQLVAEIQNHHDYYNAMNMNKLIAAALKLSKQHDKRTGCYAILASLFCGGRPQSEVFNLTTL